MSVPGRKDPTCEFTTQAKPKRSLMLLAFMLAWNALKTLMERGGQLAVKQQNRAISVSAHFHELSYIVFFFEASVHLSGDPMKCCITHAGIALERTHITVLAIFAWLVSMLSSLP